MGKQNKELIDNMSKVKRTTRTGRSESNYNFPTREKITTSAQSAITRSEILDEIWAAKKYTVDGKWYVCLSDVCEILGEDYAAREDK
tara:strand:- start:1656 stop:1916 length:261 start_codon:yes stop_codon:yes gene_type:complete